MYFFVVLEFSLKYPTNAINVISSWSVMSESTLTIRSYFGYVWREPILDRIFSESDNNDIRR
jgi:hypothetical protein